MNEVGAAIRWYRMLAGMTQTEMCEKTGIPQSRMSLYERDFDSPRLRELEDIAYVLGTDVETILFKPVEQVESTGECIAEAMRRLGVSKKELAERLGRSPYNVQAYLEIKQARPNTLKQVADALGVTVRDIITIKKKPLHSGATEK